MRIATVSSALVGKKLAKTIFTADGKALLSAGVTLTPALIESLRRRGFQSVYIQNELLPDLVVDDAVNEETRIKATAIVKQTMDDLAVGRRVNLSRVSKVVDSIIDDLQHNSDLVFSLSALRSVDEYTFAHSVNVCVLCGIIGTALHYSRDDLHKLGVGALLHDLGKVQMADLVRKPDRLTEAEWERMKTHAQVGFDILRANFEINLLSAHVAFQHHEHMDGSGYPRGLRGHEIHEFGRIAAVADVYDALSSDRSYRPRLDPVQVAEHLIKESGPHLDPEIVRKLLTRVALYPTGSIVVLSSRQVAVVVAQGAGDVARPRVKVVTDENYNMIEPQEIDLAERPDLVIKAVLADFPARVHEQLRRSACTV